MFQHSIALDAEGCTVSTFKAPPMHGGAFQVYTLVSFASGIDVVVLPDGTVTTVVPQWIMDALEDALCPPPAS